MKGGTGHKHVAVCNGTPHPTQDPLFRPVVQGGLYGGSLHELQYMIEALTWIVNEQMAGAQNMVKIHTTTFDQIVQNLSRTGTQQARQIVWDYINAMPTLYFVQCGREACPVPWVVFENEAPIAMVFTEYDHALQTSKALIEDHSHIRVLGLPTNAASMYVTALAAQGIEYVCFNHGPQRFDAPMEEVLLARMVLC